MQTESLINFDAVAMLKSLQDDESGFLAEVLAIFESRTPPAIQQMKKFFSDRDWSSLRTVAHALKGSSMQIGAEALSNLSRDLEKAGDDALSSNGLQILSAIDRVYPQTLDELKKLLLH